MYYDISKLIVVTINLVRYKFQGEFSLVSVTFNARLIRYQALTQEFCDDSSLRKESVSRHQLWMTKQKSLDEHCTKLYESWYTKYELKGNVLSERLLWSRPVKKEFLN